MVNEIQCTMKVSNLVAVMEKNRKTHIANYKKAMAVFKKKVQAKLEWMQKAVAAGKRIHMSVNLLIPMKFVEDYDRVIFMLTHTTDKVITLSEVQYQQYVMDKWNWGDHFHSNTMCYASGPTGPQGTTGMTGPTVAVNAEKEFGKIEEIKHLHT